MSVWYQDIFLTGSISGAANAAATKAGMLGTLQMDALNGTNPYRALDNYSLTIGLSAAGGSVYLKGCSYPGSVAGTPTYQAIDTTNGPYVAIRTFFWTELPVGVNCALADSAGYTALQGNAGMTGTGLFTNRFGPSGDVVKLDGTSTTVAVALYCEIDDTDNKFVGPNIQSIGIVSGGTEKRVYASAQVIRGPVLDDNGSPIADTWWCEGWLQAPSMNNIDSPNWFCAAVGQCYFPGGVAPITAFVAPVNTSVAMYVHWVDCLWGQDTTYGGGQTEPSYDPAIVSSNKLVGNGAEKSLYHSAVNTPIPYWITEFAPGPIPSGAAIIASGAVVAAFTEGMGEGSGDCRMNLYHATNAACSAWSAPIRVFIAKTQPGIQLTYNNPGHTGYYTVTNSATAATRYLNLYVDGTDGGHLVAQITLTPLSVLLSSILPTIGGYTGWSAIIDPAAGSSGGGNAAAGWLCEQLTPTVVPITGLLIPVDFLMWEGRLTGQGKAGNLLIAAGVRMYQYSVQVGDVVQTLSTDGGATWSTEITLPGCSQITNGPSPFDILWSAHQQCWIVAIYAYGASNHLYICKSISSNGDISDKSRPVLASDWSGTEITLSPGETTLAEADDGTLVILSRNVLPSYASYTYSTDGGTTWSALQALDGTFSGGVQVRSPVCSSNAPLAAKVVGGYLWVLAPSFTAGPAAYRNAMVVLRSKTPICAATLATGLLLSVVSPGMWVGGAWTGLNAAAYPKFDVSGAAVLITYGRDLKRLYYDPSFFAAEITVPPPAVVLTGIQYGIGGDELAGTLGNFTPPPVGFGWIS